MGAWSEAKAAEQAAWQLRMNEACDHLLQQFRQNGWGAWTVTLAERVAALGLPPHEPSTPLRLRKADEEVATQFLRTLPWAQSVFFLLC